MSWQCPTCGCVGVAAELQVCPQCGKERQMPKATTGGPSNAWEEQPDEAPPETVAPEAEAAAQQDTQPQQESEQREPQAPTATTVRDESDPQIPAAALPLGGAVEPTPAAEADPPEVFAPQPDPAAVAPAGADAKDALVAPEAG